MNQTEYETVCQKRGCKNVVTGRSHVKQKRTCFDCKSKRRNELAAIKWRREHPKK